MISDDEAYGLRCTIGQLLAENKRLVDASEGSCDMDFKKELGSRLTAARKSAGLTQRELSAKLGVTESCICNYEIGKRLPNIMIIRRMSDVLGKNMDDLVPDHVAH